MGQILTTCAGMTGGVTAVTGVGKRYRVEFTGTYAIGDLLSVILTNATTGQSVTAGKGTVTGLSPTFLMTFKKKMNAIAGDALYFSDFQGDPTVFNSVNGAGNGFIPMSNQFGTAEDQKAISNFQSGLAVIARNTTQIWDVDPLVENYNQRQVLKGVGTCAPASVQAQGDADVYLLADSGIRSIRVRAATTNAIVSDVGSPVQKLVKAVLQTLTDTQKAAACSIIEPETNSYWIYIPGGSSEGYIWVFSYYQESGVAAWSKYRATINKPPLSTTWAGLPSSFWYIRFTGLTIGRKYNFQRGAVELAAESCILVNTSYSPYLTDADGQITATETEVGVLIEQAATPAAATAMLNEVFTPEKFIILDGRVYVRSGDDVYLYGGDDNQTYDRCGMQLDTPFLNAKSPATRKMFAGLDVACEGQWTASLGVKPSDADAVRVIYRNTDSSFERGKSLSALQGTHFKLRLAEDGEDYAIFSSAIVHFEGGDNK